MTNFDCGECRRNRHAVCAEVGCNCFETGHEFPIRAPKRLVETVHGVLRDTSQTTFERANLAVMTIAGALAYESANRIDLMEMAVVLFEREWA